MAAQVRRNLRNGLAGRFDQDLNYIQTYFPKWEATQRQTLLALLPGEAGEQVDQLMPQLFSVQVLNTCLLSSPKWSSLGFMVT